MSDVVSLECARFRLDWDRGSRQRAMAIAKDFLASNPQLVLQLRQEARAYAELRADEPLTSEHIVALVDEYRRKGLGDAVTIADMALTTGLWDEPSVVGFVDVEVPEFAQWHMDLERMEAAWKTDQRETALELARDIVRAGGRELERVLRGLSREQCVRLLEQERDAGRRFAALVVQAWLWSEYEPVPVRGAMNVGLTARAVQQGLERKRALR